MTKLSLAEVLNRLGYDTTVLDSQVLEHTGKHFSDVKRKAGLDYVNVVTQVRIAAALERIATSLEKATGNVSDEAQG